MIDKMQSHIAPDCDDQLPLYSRVGRGIQGDSIRIDVSDPDTNTETYLDCYAIDSATHEETHLWRTENINGGELRCYYNLRPYSIPQCFTITFVYDRPGRESWSWTTPAIPYVWDVDGDGQPDADDIVGTGVATVFIKTRDGQVDWDELLVYPENTTREYFNAPDPNDPWTVNLDFGSGGNIEIPNFDDLAKLIGGMTGTELLGFLKGTYSKMPHWVDDDGNQVANIKEYIDDQDDIEARKRQAAIDALEDQVYDDLGFGDSPLSKDVKQYIDDAVAAAAGDVITEITAVINALKTNLASIIYGASVNSAGEIVLENGKIPIADLNFFAGTSSPSNTTYSNALRSRSVSNYDIKAV